MHTAVRQVSVHTVDLCQVLGAAYRADIHFQFFVTTVIAVSQGKVYTLIISQSHRSCGSGYGLLHGYSRSGILHTGSYRHYKVPRNVPPDPVSRSESRPLLHDSGNCCLHTDGRKRLLRYRISYGTAPPEVRKDSLPVFRKLHKGNRPASLNSLTFLLIYFRTSRANWPSSAMDLPL